MKNVRRTIKSSLRTFTSLMFCFTLGVLGPCGTMMSTSVHAESQVKSQKFQLIVSNSRARQATFQANSAKYDSTMRSLSALEQAPLKTEADVKKVLAVLQKNQLSNDLILGKGFTIAINVSSFKQGIRSEVDRSSVTAVSRQVNQKSIALSRIGGFNDLKSSLKQQFDSDSSTLSRLGQRLQTASRQHGISELFDDRSTPTVARHTHSTPAAGFSILAAKFQQAPDAIAQAMMTNAAYSAAPQFDPITASALGGIALACVAFVIIAYAQEKLQDTEEDPNTGVSQIGACQDDARNKRDACLDKHDGDFWAQAGCWGTYTVDEATCLIVPL